MYILNNVDDVNHLRIKIITISQILKTTKNNLFVARDETRHLSVRPAVVKISRQYNTNIRTVYNRIKLWNNGRLLIIKNQNATHKSAKSLH